MALRTDLRWSGEIFISFDLLCVACCSADESYVTSELGVVGIVNRKEILRVCPLLLLGWRVILLLLRCSRLLCRRLILI